MKWRFQPLAPVLLYTAICFLVLHVHITGGQDD